MSFLSDLGNIFHAIGGFITGGNSNPSQPPQLNGGNPYVNNNNSNNFSSGGNAPIMVRQNNPQPQQQQQQQPQPQAPPPPTSLALYQGQPARAPGTNAPAVGALAPPAPDTLLKVPGPQAPAAAVAPPPPTPSPPVTPVYHNPRNAALAQALRDGRINVDQFSAAVNSLQPNTTDPMPNVPVLAGADALVHGGINTAKLAGDAVSTLVNQDAQSAQATKNAFDGSLIGGLAPIVEHAVGSLAQPEALQKAQQAEDYSNKVLTPALTVNPTTGEVNPNGLPLKVKGQSGYTTGGARQASLDASQARLGILQQSIDASGLQLNDTLKNNILKAAGNAANASGQIALLGLGGEGDSLAKVMFDAALKTGLSPEEATILANTVPKVGKGEKALTGATIMGGGAGLTDLTNGQTNPGQVGLDITKNALPGLLVPALEEGIGNASRIAGEGLDKIPALAKTPAEVDVGLRSTNPNEAADAAQQMAEKQAAAAPPPPPEAAPAPTEPVVPQGEPSAPPAPAAPAPEPQVAQTPTPSETPQPAPAPTAAPTGARTAPDAPNVLPALNQHLADAAKVAGDPTEHDVFSNPQLNHAGEQVVAQTPVEELLTKYNGVPDLSKAADASVARASIMKLAPLVESTDQQVAAAARQALSNIAEGLSKGVSGAGRLQNYFQSMLDSLPRPAKIPFVITTLDKIREAGGLPLIKDDVAFQDTVTKKLDSLFSTQEALKANVAALEDRGNQAALDAVQGTKNDVSDLHKQLDKDTMALQKQNGEIVKYYQSLVPGSSIGQKANSLQRTSMLSSPMGRANTGIFAGANALNQGLQNLTQGLLAKAVNLVKPGAALDTLQGGSRVLPGVGNGLTKTWREIRGDSFIDDTSKTLQTLKKAGKSGANVDDMANLQGGDNSNFFPKTTNLIKTVTHSPSNLTEGMRDQRIYQLAYQEGQSKGLSGDMLRQYAEGRSATPSPQMRENGVQLWKSINHMNDNPISNALGKISSAISETTPNAADSAGAKAGQFVAGAIKNQTLPFTRFLGGNLWNSITDKNVVASGLKTVYYGFKGDINGVVENLAKTGNNLAYTYALGYLLTQSGLITNTDANGHTDAGAYLHIGSHFIPVNDLGFFAPSLILGNALYQGINSNGDGVSKFGKILGASITNGAKSMGASALGVDNSAAQALSTLIGTRTTPGSAAGAGAQFAGNFAGEYIPAATSDVNAVLNRYTPLNPTREAALTKVTKGSEGITTNSGNPSTAKDIVASEGNTLLNKIPFASQALPRNPAVAAPDLEDRLSKGTHLDPTQVNDLQKAAAAKAPGTPNGDKLANAADRAAFLKSGKEMDTINGKFWVNNDGQPHAYNTQLQAQQALDNAKYQSGELKDFNKDVNGKVYLKGSDGKVTSMDTKDYDYKQASDQIADAKSNKDLNGTLDAQGKLLGNISWQLNHADLTPAARGSLIDTAAKTQADNNKYQLWGDFTKPKGAPTYTPEFKGTTPKSSAYIQTIKEAGAKYGVDINALLSVAAQEGLGGGVGDNGTSFGPFQMHVGGALPPGKDQAWAESPAGIDYAVQQIANVAKGKIGPEAIKAIVTQFEKSADQPTEIANALAVYEGGTAHLNPDGSGSTVTPSSSSTASATRAANLVKQNTVGNLLQPTRESFLSNLMQPPQTLNLPEPKLTPPGSLLPAHKISVSSMRA